MSRGGNNGGRDGRTVMVMNERNESEMVMDDDNAKRLANHVLLRASTVVLIDQRKSTKKIS
jgi:hypothetical protein